MLDTSLCTPLPERLIHQVNARSSPLHPLSPSHPSNPTPKRPRDSTIGLTMSAALVTGRRVKTRPNYAALARGDVVPEDEDMEETPAATTTATVQQRGRAGRGRGGRSARSRGIPSTPRSKTSRKGDQDEAITYGLTEYLAMKP
jgi:hypothetical protein